MFQTDMTSDIFPNRFVMAMAVKELLTQSNDIAELSLDREILLNIPCDTSSLKSSKRGGSAESHFRAHPCDMRLILTLMHHYNESSVTVSSRIMPRRKTRELKLPRLHITS